jgi:hypothetical protein
MLGRIDYCSSLFPYFEKINLLSMLIESAKEASGQNDKFCSISDKLPLDMA